MLVTVLAGMIFLGMMCGELEAENTSFFRRTDIGNMSSSSGLWKPTREMSELLDHHEVPSGSKQKPMKAWGGGGGAGGRTWECRVLPTASGAAVPVGAGVSPLPPGLLCLGGSPHGLWGSCVRQASGHSTAGLPVSTTHFRAILQGACLNL